jgi:DNA-binding winged helix-turn-helix (wHTH) protein/TolB-like protein/Flp pilus assembly protein TadD
MAKQARHLYEFGTFRIVPTERQLLREGQPIVLPTKAFDTLLLLVQGHGHLFEKSEIMKAVWPDTFVEEGNLAVVVSMLRKALGDEDSEHRYIQTVPRHGYRFVPDVREIVEAEPDLPPPPAVSTPLLSEAPPGRRLSYRLGIGAFLVLAGLAVAATTLMHLLRPSGTPAEIHSLAVLPFKLMNSDLTYDYLRLGLADAIITKLASTGQIIVRPTSAVLKYADSPTDPLTFGRAQKVDAILSGYVETFPDHVRATVQLVRVGDGSLLWADTFEANPQRIFGLEDEVAERVVQSMSIRLSAASKMRLAQRETENSKAYQLYLEGRYFWNKRTEEGLRRSIVYFQLATKEDPQYALAYTGLADSYVLLDSHGVQPALKAHPLAKTAALKALQLDNFLAEAHTSSAMVYFYYEWNWPEADQEFRRAIALNPNYELAHTWYASYLGAMGRYEEALGQVRRAQELDPLSLEINMESGRDHYFGRQYGQSIDAFRKVIDLDSRYARAHTCLGITYAAAGSFGEAIREFKESQRLSGSDDYLNGLLEYAQARSGNSGHARKFLEELTSRSQRQDVPAFSIALVYIGLGNRDRALEWLDKAYRDRSSYMVFAKADPLLDPLRSDVRFDALLHRMGFM